MSGKLQLEKTRSTNASVAASMMWQVEMLAVRFTALQVSARFGPSKEPRGQTLQTRESHNN